MQIYSEQFRFSVGQLVTTKKHGGEYLILAITLGYCRLMSVHSEMVYACSLDDICSPGFDDASRNAAMLLDTVPFCSPPINPKASGVPPGALAASGGLHPNNPTMTNGAATTKGPACLPPAGGGKRSAIPAGGCVLPAFQSIPVGNHGDNTFTISSVTPK